MVLVSIFTFIAGVLIGYLFFYIKYENRDVIIELRNSLKDSNRELAELSLDYEEHKQQNIILKEKVTELFDKNDDLVGVVSELSRYYFNIKVGAEKIQELNKLLQLPDSLIEDKVQRYSAMHYAKNKAVDGEGSMNGSGQREDDKNDFF